MQGRHLALARLRETCADLLCTRVIALHLGLPDAHTARAHQLVQKMADTLTVVRQLIEGVGR